MPQCLDPVRSGCAMACFWQPNAPSPCSGSLMCLVLLLGLEDLSGAVERLDCLEEDEEEEEQEEKELGLTVCSEHDC